MIGFWPSLVRQVMSVCKSSFSIFGEGLQVEYCHAELTKTDTASTSNLCPIMQEREHVVWGIHRIHRVFWKEATAAVKTLLKVSLLSCLDIVKVDGDKAVPVRPCMLVDKAESMDQLVNWSHEAFIETATVEGECQTISVGIQFYLLKLITCSPPTLPTSLLHTLTPSRMRT